MKIENGELKKLIDNTTINDYESKINQNKIPTISKDFLDLTDEEKAKFIDDAKNKYFYYQKDGVFVAYGKELNNKDGKFDIELFACKKLAEFGHEVYLLPEDYAKDENGFKKIHGDTITDNRSLELKHTQSSIQRNFREARHQATDVFIHIIENISEEIAVEQIKKALRSSSGNYENANVYLYFGKLDILKKYEVIDKEIREAEVHFTGTSAISFD